MPHTHLRSVSLIALICLGGTSRAQFPATPGPQAPHFSGFSPIVPGSMGSPAPFTPARRPAPPLDGRAGATQPMAPAAHFADEFRNGRHSTKGTTGAYSGPFRFASTGTPATAARDQAFEAARTTLVRMLDGREPLHLGNAIEAMERPFLETTGTHASLGELLDQVAKVVRAHIASSGGDANDPLMVHWGIQALYRDTFVDPTTGRTWSPLRYDFDDPNGEEDIRKVTVGKLLLTGEGQCRSMPLLYLALAERLHAEAYLAFAPNHSFVKFRDGTGTFHNFETTNGRLASDAWLAGSGHVRTEGIKSRAYLDTVGTRRVVAHLLVELAAYYAQRHGYAEPFMEQCLQRALKEYPQDIHGWMELSNLRTATFDRALWQAGQPALNDLERLRPDLAERLADLKALYGQVDRLGYAPMPPELYARWRSSVDAAKEERLRKTLAQPLPPARIVR
ncbi:MAG: hypothetical protein IPM49_02000 [Flavobacteriales bacterium]|nr:hypothetical protein [Flavobacteriales bacterium]